jgi:hypothetical protein
MEIYAQGDLVFVKIEDAEKLIRKMSGNAVRAASRKGKIILARGEKTGHTHTIDARVADLFNWGKDEVDYPPSSGKIQDAAVLVVSEPTTVEHQEHPPLDLPAGAYRVVRQRRYEPKRLPRAID